MKWITRERPKIDRIACPWLILRFIDKDAEIIYVPDGQVLDIALKQNATPFDIPGVEYSHYQDRCTFDYFLEKYKLNDEALHKMAAIVRGADTDRHDFSPQSAGLEAIFAGLSYNIQNDQELLNLGLTIYDGLYVWAQKLSHLKHSQTGKSELLLIQVYQQYLSTNKGKRTPKWAKVLKEMIQDQLDTNMVLSLQQASEELAINPTYLSREFSKHFDNLSFGEYMRKLRIDKAIEFMTNEGYTLTEIAYLTGFSDQSHFNRTFKKQIGQNPFDYRQNLRLGKNRTS